MRLQFRPLLPAVAALSALAVVPASAHAHFIWATIENNQARFALLENPAEAPNAAFASYVENLTPRCGDQTLVLGVSRGGARFAALPATVSTSGGVVTADSTIGVKDRDGDVYLLVYHARGAASLEAASIPTNAPAEALARRDGSELVVTVRQSGWTSPAAEVTVHWPGVSTPVTATADLKGEVRVPWPSNLGAGPIGVRAKVVEKVSGENGGRKYDQVNHWATLTFPGNRPSTIPTVRTAATTVSVNASANGSAKGPADEKSTRILLREAFGGNHEKAGSAAFNETLFAGKLTREQLITHLQQRALVHNETHRILIGASPALKVPYSPAQRNVLTLLFTDLIDMGSGWPIEAQARPLTREFLQEIRDSEKRGPYFALGIQHVYFGGITNGGRTIGEKIAETLGISLTYYAKSDGYLPYLTEVDKITNPAARAEMIRGGQAAYRYIIASSNEPVFQPQRTTASAPVR